jgi:hypothetical protein
VAARQGPPGTQQPGLIRVSEDLKIGEHTFVPPPSATAVQGVMPGSKAFAQLHNGNYFIGGVKKADATSITLKLVDEGGEITLQLDAIARLTELGSSDYAELQKVTTGFVRLTNNNRLVGGILSQIADDHVVLEFRKNRVMVPRSAIGAVVQGDDDLSVRLDTTSEEDNWLRPAGRARARHGPTDDAAVADDPEAGRFDAAAPAALSEARRDSTVAASRSGPREVAPAGRVGQARAASLLAPLCADSMSQSLFAAALFVLSLAVAAPAQQDSKPGSTPSRNSPST